MKENPWRRRDLSFIFILSFKKILSFLFLCINFPIFSLGSKQYISYLEGPLIVSFLFFNVCLIIMNLAVLALPLFLINLTGKYSNFVVTNPL